MVFVMEQSRLEAMIGAPRLVPYLRAAEDDIEKAIELYHWAAQLSGVLHTQLSYVEVAVRNALDPVLGIWNEEHGGSRAWTAENSAVEPLYSLLRSDLQKARRFAQQNAARRSEGHPRNGKDVIHDDILTQLTFGSWTMLIYGHKHDQSRQQQLWNEATHAAFPNVSATEESRINIGRQLESLQFLRNRCAHHENLLDVNVKARLNWMLSLLAKIDSDYPGFAVSTSSLRRLDRQDPRRSW